ncbi:hypothetical protein BRADI_2g01735v3 [Brachypodium distachyon]|uniref:Uncharacterized protein n=1 Tax=Brachypodium distachyon TaxID=15368 RepID=A0A2K2D6F1_BRADI|nr:hypothetical protein BRADI_2g01735v3 [Brachypodium distachyon]
MQSHRVVFVQTPSEQHRRLLVAEEDGAVFLLAVRRRRLLPRRAGTSTHLFVECPFSSQLWCAVALWPNCRSIAVAIRDAASVLSFRDHLMAATRADLRKGMSSLFLLVCHSIWRERNSRVFHDKALARPQLASFIKDEAQEWTFAGAKALHKLL